MATTSPTGIYQAEGGDAAGLAAIWKAQNDSLDSSISPEFASTTARDTAVAAITGRAGSPPPFRSCYITGTGPQQYIEGNGWQWTNTTPLAIGEGSRSTVATISGTFLDVTMGSQQRMIGIGVNAGFFVVQTPGWYSLSLSGTWAFVGGTNRRIMSFTDLATSDSDMSASTGTRDQRITYEGFLAAGFIIKPRIYQNTGSNLSMTGIRMTARLVDNRITS